MAVAARWQDLCLDLRDAGNSGAAGRFWAFALGLEPDPTREGCLVGGVPEQTLWLNDVPEPKRVKNRVHIDLVRDDLAPLLALGAVVLSTPQQSGNDWYVLADPEGNELCVFPDVPGEPLSLVTDTADPEGLAAWWGGVLGVEPVSGTQDGLRRWLREVPGMPFEVWKFVGVDDERAVKNRMHWDVQADVDELVARGARVLRAHDEEIGWSVLADPEGNEFCVFAPE